MSEALKSEVYLWLARTGDYRNDPAATRLRATTDRVRGDGADLLRYRHGIVAEQRDLPAVHDLPSTSPSTFTPRSPATTSPRSR